MTNGRHDYSFRNCDFLDYRRLTPTGNAATPADCFIDDSWEIVAPASNSRLVRYFTGDLYRFFCECLGICLRVVRTDNIQKYLENPKKKSKKHIQIIKEGIDEQLRMRLKSGTNVYNEEIKRAIKEFSHKKEEEENV